MKSFTMFGLGFFIGSVLFCCLNRQYFVILQETIKTQRSEIDKELIVIIQQNLEIKDLLTKRKTSK